MNNKVIDISKKTFISVIIILGILILATIVLTYILPKGQFVETTNEAGEIVVHYDEYIKIEGTKGINIFKGLFSPILLLFANGGIAVIMLSIFLIVISGSFQIMSDVGGMQAIVEKMINRFKNHKRVLIAIVVLVFMILGSFFGLFEETLTLLPIIILLAISLGYDSYLGFLMCTVATGFGFASAITNPFSVLIASKIIGVSPMVNIWYRIIIFIVMYGLLLSFIYIYTHKLDKDITKSPTYEQDLIKKNNLETTPCEDNLVNKKIFITYIIFLLIVFITIITVTSISALRDYTVIFLIIIFLFGGIIAGLIASSNFKFVMKSFGKGVISALPAILMVLMASSIKYILVEGQILPTITNSITTMINGKSPFLVLAILFAIILVLEFFISSSTAKAIFVMGILAGVSMNISKELLVLTYVFGDGYTNVLFPTSPVLLIALSMCGMSYGNWLKKSKWLFVSVFVLALIFLYLGLIINY